jgi:hypothetical protein
MVRLAHHARNLQFNRFAPLTMGPVRFSRSKRLIAALSSKRLNFAAENQEPSKISTTARIARVIEQDTDDRLQPVAGL